MQSVSVYELKQMMDDQLQFQLIDVREPDEHAAFNLGGELIPLGDIARYVDRIATDKPVVIYCRKGIRSQFAIQKLLEKQAFLNLMNLTGGTVAWLQAYGGATNANQ